MAKRTQQQERTQSVDTTQTGAVLELPQAVEIDASKYTPEYVPQTRLTVKQRRGQRKLVEALQASGTVLPDGRSVDGPARALKWVYEQVDDLM